MIIVLRREGTGASAPLKRDKMADALETEIRRLGIVLLVLDPLVSLSAGASENDTDDMNALLQELTKMAARHSIGLVVVHHTAKSTRNSHGDMAASRGSFAIPAKARAMATMGHLDEKSAAEFGVPVDGHIRLDYAKVSHGKKPAGSIVLRVRSVPVGNSRTFREGELDSSNLTPAGKAAATRGDYAPVLETVMAAKPRSARNEKFIHDRDSAARAVMDALKAPGVYTFAGYWQALAQAFRKSGVTKSDSRNTITEIVKSRLAGEGAAIEHGGQFVRVLARQSGATEKAPWIIEIRPETGPQDGSEAENLD